MTRLSAVLVAFAFGLALVLGPSTAHSQVKKPNDPKAKAPAPKPKTPTPKPPTPKTPAPEPEPSLPPAEEPSGLPSPLRLVQGLRDKGLADLGIQLIDSLDSKSPDAAEFPLEKAMCKLALANDATEEAVKSTLLADARGLLDTFLKSSAKHPRMAEARLSLAKLTSLEAKSLLQKARRAKEAAEQKKGRDSARALFTKASQEYATAAKDIAAALTAMPDSLARRTLQREKVQAELDSAVNLFNLYLTYGSREDLTATQLQEQSKTLDAARAAFAALTTGPANTTVVWIAKAWMAEIDTMQQKPEAKASADEVSRAGTGAADAGRRLLKYFEIKRAFDTAGSQQDITTLQTLGRQWLARYDTPRRPTDESVHVKYMVGLSLEGEVRGTMGLRAKGPKAPKLIDANATERTKLKEAEKLFREIAASENDYTDKATDHRMTVVRLMIGSTIKPAKEYAKFEDAHMAALVQQGMLRDKKDEKEIKEGREQLITLLERSRKLATPLDSPADVISDQVTLAAMYLVTGRPYEAAVLSEYLARMPRPIASRSAQAGELAVAAYLSSAAKAPAGEEGEEARKSDRDRAMKIGQFVEQAFPVEAATDAVRYRLGIISYSAGKPVAAFDYLSRIKPAFSYVNEARMMEGVIAHQLLIPADSPLPASRKVEVFRKALEDLEAVQAPAGSAPSDDAIEYARLRVRLCLLYLIHQRIEPKVSSYDKAEATADALATALDTFTGFTPEHKLEAKLLALDLKTRSVYLQGAAMLDKGQVDELIAKLDPILKAIDNSGAAVNEKLGENPLEGNLAKLAASLDSDRRDVVLLALKAYIRKVQIDEAKKQLDRLVRLGGSIDTNLSALSQLVNEVRAQILQLRKDDPEASKNLSEGLTQLITQITSGDVKTPVRIFAGQALLAVDRYNEAAAELEKVPTADPADLGKPTAELNEQLAKLTTAADAGGEAAKKELESFKQRMEALRFHKAAALYRMRALRQAKQYAPADALATEVVGTDEKKGWGFYNSEYKKEAFLLAEAKAMDSPPGRAATAFWSQAVKGWGSLAGTQQGRLRLLHNKLFDAQKAAEAAPEDAGVQATLNQAKADVERNKAIYFDYFFETSRCSLMAYQSVYKGDAEKMKAKYDSEAMKMVNLEYQNQDLAPEVRTKYIELLEQDTMKELRAAYEAARAAFITDTQTKLTESVNENQKSVAAAQQKFDAAEAAKNASPGKKELEDAAKQAQGDLERAKAEQERLKGEQEKLKAFGTGGKMFEKRIETPGATTTSR